MDLNYSLAHLLKKRDTRESENYVNRSSRFDKYFPPQPFYLPTRQPSSVEDTSIPGIASPKIEKSSLLGRSLRRLNIESLVEEMMMEQTDMGSTLMKPTTPAFTTGMNNRLSLEDNMNNIDDHALEMNTKLVSTTAKVQMKNKRQYDMKHVQTKVKDFKEIFNQFRLEVQQMILEEKLKLNLSLKSQLEGGIRTLIAKHERKSIKNSQKNRFSKLKPTPKSRVLKLNKGIQTDEPFNQETKAYVQKIHKRLKKPFSKSLKQSATLIQPTDILDRDQIIRLQEAEQTKNGSKEPITSHLTTEFEKPYNSNSNSKTPVVKVTKAFGTEEKTESQFSKKENNSNAKSLQDKIESIQLNEGMLVMDGLNFEFYDNDGTDSNLSSNLSYDMIEQ